MAKRLIDYNPFSGITTFCDYNPVTDETTIIHEFADVEGALDLNKAMANDADYTRAGMKRDWWHYASIPMSLIHKWLVEEGIDVFDRNDEWKVYQKVNSPEYRYLKTTAKHHQVKR